MIYLAAAGGLALLLVGGELLVRGAVGLARALGVSPLVVGLTVVAFGTSVPELVVCLEAALGAHPDIVLGNVVGSNIANLLAIGGFAAVLRPIAVSAGLVRRDGGILLAATAGFILACLAGELSRALGAVMVGGLVAYTWWSFWAARRREAAAIAELAEAREVAERAPRRTWLAALITAAGIAGVLLGADLLIEGAVEIARVAGLSEAVIGLTLIAFGTSLPELATAGMAALRGHSDLALGNALGSNMFNMLGIAGITALVARVPVPDELIAFDLWAMLAVTVVMLVMMTTHRRLSRAEGGVLLAGYVVYIAVLVSGGAPRLM